MKHDATYSIHTLGEGSLIAFAKFATVMSNEVIIMGFFATSSPESTQFKWQIKKPRVASGEWGGGDGAVCPAVGDDGPQHDAVTTVLPVATAAADTVTFSTNECSLKA
ncbi:hypothetical protein Bhyg_05767 [Pseudolycoriella hygida]|uniref:Uncharacterized protein n=1 Tax=Pseudolycoriella hygida TaxID=35572 RepID=A0A9Q0MZG6_9DIPT|nr:hypothetical protein Bhyg_05767 [Pseudolycoriella hygida]